MQHLSPVQPTFAPYIFATAIASLVGATGRKSRVSKGFRNRLPLYLGGNVVHDLMDLD